MRSCKGLFAVALLALGSLGQEVKAGETWDGEADGLWTNGLNWNPDGPPNYALGLQFGGVLNLNSDNDAATGTIGGTGITFNAGAGAFTLTGSPITLTGGITNNSANVQTISFGLIGTGVTLGAGPPQTWNAGVVAGGGLNVTSSIDLAGQVLIVDGTNNTAISGVIADSGVGGSLTKNGTGTLTTSNLLNSYTGPTTVFTGTLNVLGNHLGGGNYAILAGATLAGTGTIATALNVSINNNGAIIVGDSTLAVPVSSTFTLTTQGGIAAINMGPISTLAVDLFTGAGFGNNNLVLGASDTFNLGGNLNSVVGGTLVIGNPTGMTGFTGGDSWQVVTLLPGATITGNLGQGANLNTLALNLTPTQVGNFNQTTGVFTIVDTLTGLQMANVLGQAVLAGVQTVLTDVNGRLFFLRAGQGDLTDDSEYNAGVIDGQGDGPGKNPGPVAQRRPRSSEWEVFASMNYNGANLGSIGGLQAGVESDSWSPGIGAELHVTPNVAIGFALNWLESSQTFANNVGSMNMDGYALSAYASYVNKAFWADLLYNFGSYDIETNRNPIGFGVARGETDAYTHSVQFNSGWNFRFQNNSLVTGPFIGLDYTHVSIDGYGETTGGLAALAYNKRTAESLISRIGWSVSKYIRTDFAVITAQARLSYERQNLNNNSGTAVSLINQPFVLGSAGQSFGQDYMVAGAGLNFQFTPVFGMLLNYQGQFFRQSVQAHYAGVRFSYKF